MFDQTFKKRNIKFTSPNEHIIKYILWHMLFSTSLVKLQNIWLMTILGINLFRDKGSILLILIINFGTI